jgi:hypothetical protein
MKHPTTSENMCNFEITMLTRHNCKNIIIVVVAIVNGARVS